ncbi:hypothetical protein [Legionella oakridgensis]|uniref:HEPN domain-containing protein n=2 Tax=Legionella oakridgensis TaxID=29423 RepID=W0BF16_9GAMM|nr:hypothetical protein [Legionella oakridgensis]AHE68465.1 hypothetical protein Loa_02937 [Legionella oakridgensis ATCC 33761 = DSM 21215]ETO92131.1 hypothetical protein LOR_35c03320 [Legionella oakridgensis RV-2-2007]KTD38382.1 hypothetical protein Loak_1327 [Legionella oakridgensis]STY21401.1 Uncharacterised protein [Legionella longbeachae]
MNKHYLDAVDMLKIAAQHAYCAEYLLKQNAEIHLDENYSIDALLPITSLMHLAFELTLKACLLHEHRQLRQYKNLLELVELNSHLGLSKEELKLITTLSRQQAFRKGTDYMLWENRQQLHAFCEQIMRLYAHLPELMPLELQIDYQ